MSLFQIRYKTTKSAVLNQMIVRNQQACLTYQRWRTSGWETPDPAGFHQSSHADKALNNIIDFSTLSDITDESDQKTPKPFIKAEAEKSFGIFICSDIKSFASYRKSKVERRIENSILCTERVFSGGQANSDIFEGEPNNQVLTLCHLLFQSSALVYTLMNMLTIEAPHSLLFFDSYVCFVRENLNIYKNKSWSLRFCRTSRVISRTRVAEQFSAKPAHFKSKNLIQFWNIVFPEYFRFLYVQYSFIMIKIHRVCPG